MRILVTRPQPDAATFAAELEARGHEAVLEPLLTIVPAPEAALPEELDAFQALLITSAAGLRAFAGLTERRDLTVFTVGAASAAAAREAGFARVESAGGDVEDLVRLVSERLSPDEGLLLHAAGSVLAGDLKGSLEAAGFTVSRSLLYTAETAAELTDSTQAALRAGEIDAVAVFSPRTAETLVALLRQAGLAEAAGGLRALCLSPAVAARLEDLSWAGVAVAARPETEALFEALDGLTEARRTESDPKTLEPKAGGDETMSEDENKSAETAEGESPAMRVIGRFGGIRPMAQKLGVAVSTVQGWREREVIPPNRHKQIRKAANKARIDLPAEELAAAGHRPDKAETLPAPEAAQEPEVMQEPEVVQDSVAEPESNPMPAAVAASEIKGPPRTSEPAEPEPQPETVVSQTPEPSSSQGESESVAAAPPPPQPSETEAAKGGAAWLPAFLLGGLVFAGGLGAAVVARDLWLPLVQGPVTVQAPAVQSGAASEVEPGSRLAARLEALEATLRQIAAAGRDGGGESAGSGEDLLRLNQEITALRGALRNLQSELETTQAEAEAGSARGADLEALLETAEERLNALESLGGRVELLSGKAEAAGDIQADLGLAAARLAAIERRLEGLPEVGPDGRLTLPREVGFVLAVTQLRDALRFPLPFKDELDMVTRLVAEDAELTEALAPLAGLAAEGVPSLAGLQSDFPAVARAIAVAGAGGDTEGAMAGVLRRLSEVVTVRPIGGDVVGGDAAAVAARAEAKVAAGDLPAALQELRALTGGAEEAAASWKARAEARLAVDGALRLLAARVVDRLAPGVPAGGPLGGTGGSPGGSPGGEGTPQTVPPEAAAPESAPAPQALEDSSPETASEAKGEPENAPPSEPESPAETPPDTAAPRVGSDG